jgi:hypothetical protein
LMMLSRPVRLIGLCVVAQHRDILEQLELLLSSIT